jgi:hypothetical protein
LLVWTKNREIFPRRLTRKDIMRFSSIVASSEQMGSAGKTGALSILSNNKRRVTMKAAGMCGALVGLLLMAAAGTAWSADEKRITQLANKVHVDLQRLVKVGKVQLPDAVKQQKVFLLHQPDVREVQELKGSNLMVRFKDGNELLMFLGEDRLGSPQKMVDLKEKIRVNPTQQVITDNRIRPDALFRTLPCAPQSNKALLFDCLEDDANVISPKIWMQIKSDLESLGYTVTTKLNNNANLANAALIDNGEYGVVFLRGHGGDLGGDFGLLVRPWYTSYPPASSGYTGTIRASAFNHVSGTTQFGYVITGGFSTAYWADTPFPSTLFFLESCHGADPGALPGMPTWTTTNGASAWVSWNESVSFNCGDNGTDLFFQKMKEQHSVGEGAAAVYETGCRPPELVAFPANKNNCQLAVWKSDANEAYAPNERDYKLLRLVSDGTRLHATISFYAVPVVNEFFFYADTGGSNAAEVLIKCRSNTFEVYKQTQPGLFNNKVYTGTPSKSGNDYRIVVPWSTAFGTANLVKLWLYDMTSKDKLPDSGSISLMK